MPLVTANTLNVAQLTLGTVDPAPDAMIQGNAGLLSLGQIGHIGRCSCNSNRF